MRYIINLWLACLALLLCVACNDGEVERNAYNTLVIAGHTYDATMSATADAYGRGIISAEQYDRAKAVARIYYGAYQTARIALEEYVAADVHSDSDRERLMSTLTALALRLAELTEYARQIGVGVHNVREADNG